MITSLSIEDNIQTTNSLHQSSLILSNKIKHLVDNLNELLKYDFAEVIIHEITEYIKVIYELNLKLQEVDKPLEKMILIRNWRTNIKHLTINRQEYITDEILGKLLNEILAHLANLEQIYKELENLQITIAYLQAINKPLDDKLTWLQNLYSSMFYILEILEDENASLIPKNALQRIEITSEALSSNKGLREYIKTPQIDENEQKTKNYMNSIRHVAKAILWELKKIKEDQPNVQSLLKFIQSSPEWKGDDFEECLDFINEERRR
ncbi:hypothetical protein [Nostoc sp.]